jgi:hypothetical protein
MAEPTEAELRAEIRALKRAGIGKTRLVEFQAAARRRAGAGLRLPAPARMLSVRSCATFYFPLGRLEDACGSAGCRAYRAAGELAGPGGAGARGGLGDAEYARGPMITAHGCFHRCVELCRKHGLGRIEVVNLPMAAFTPPVRQ